MIIRLICVLLGAVSLMAQTPSDLFLLEVDQLDDTFKLISARNLTNRNGYDNQPSFISQTQCLYTSIGEDGQADIYRFDLDKNQSTRLTFTQEAEYSPTLMPDGRSFSVIRVEASGAQRLYAFPLEGGSPRLLLPRIKPVGYHVWIDQDQLGLFVLGEPHSLYLAHLKQGANKIVGPIGRGLQKAPGGNAITFIHQETDEIWHIKKIGADGAGMETVTQTLKGSQDFVWTGGGALLMAKDSSLYRFKPGSDKTWNLLADLSNQGIKGITRLALSPNQKRIILVSVL